jgi:hypothetical protein
LYHLYISGFKSQNLTPSCPPLPGERGMIIHLIHKFCYNSHYLRSHISQKDRISSPSPLGEGFRERQYSKGLL